MHRKCLLGRAFASIEDDLNRPDGSPRLGLEGDLDEPLDEPLSPSLRVPVGFFAEVVGEERGHCPMIRDAPGPAAIPGTSDLALFHRWLEIRSSQRIVRQAWTPPCFT